jgi:hypothetical protein
MALIDMYCHSWIVGPEQAEESDNEEEDGQPNVWSGWGPRQTSSRGCGQSSGIHFQLQAFRMLAATGQFTLKAGGKKGTGFILSLPMLMDPKYKFYKACPELRMLPKNIYAFITNRYARYLQDVCPWQIVIVDCATMVIHDV